jgi:hypothetical protein
LTVNGLCITIWYEIKKNVIKKNVMFYSINQTFRCWIGVINATFSPLKPPNYGLKFLHICKEPKGYGRAIWPREPCESLLDIPLHGRKGRV